MKDRNFTERAMKNAKEMNIQSWIATRLHPRAPHKIPSEVSLGWLFPEASKPRVQAMLQTPEVNLGKSLKSVEGETVTQPEPSTKPSLPSSPPSTPASSKTVSKGSGYTPPKPRKRGEVIAKGFGGEVTMQLDKWHGDELNRKRKEKDG